MNREFFENRPRFPREELEKYRGEWVAFSPDGRRILAIGSSLPILEKNLLDVREDPSKVVCEHVSADELFLGAGEFM